jgi:hypothetical protein
MSDYSRRLGQLKYTGTFLDDGPEALQLLYSHFIPLDLHFDAAEDVYRVKGLCKAFRKIAPGELIPHYKAIFTKVPEPKLSPYAQPTFKLELYFEEVIQ